MRFTRRPSGGLSLKKDSTAQKSRFSPAYLSKRDGDNDCLCRRSWRRCRGRWWWRSSRSPRAATQLAVRDSVEGQSPARSSSSQGKASLWPTRPGMGSWGQDTFWGVFNVLPCASGAHLRLDILAQIQFCRFLDSPPQLVTSMLKPFFIVFFSLFTSILSGQITTLQNFGENM